MMSLTKTARIFVVLAVMSVYVSVVWMGFTEEERRALRVRTSRPSNDDFVTVIVEVTSVDTIDGLLHERITLIPSGRFSVDKSTPSTDLKLLINSASGKQSVVFPKGERIFPVEFISVLRGKQNRYPFDRYQTRIDLLVTAHAADAAAPPVAEAHESTDDSLAAALVVGKNDLESSQTIPIREDLTASIPGVKFHGDLREESVNKLVRTIIEMRRANAVITVSVTVMTIMVCLAITILFMVLQMMASAGEINLLPLSLCVALIFGLPALRNVQPGVPAVGVLGDYISFIWAEFIVSISAIALAWTWIVRQRKRL